MIYVFPDIYSTELRRYARNRPKAIKYYEKSVQSAYVAIIWLNSLPIPEMFQWQLYEHADPSNPQTISLKDNARFKLQWLLYCTLFNKVTCKNM